MARTYVSTVVPATAEAVWHLVRPFDGLPSWHPAIASSDLEEGGAASVGALRRLRFAGGDTEVLERLIALDDARRTFTYELVEHPFPVRRSVSTLRVLPVVDTDQAFVEWWAESEENEEDAAGAQALVEELYGSGLAALRERFTGDGPVPDSAAG
ncbi:SRPBCC family protein [Streptomyces sp. ISL-12]|uniref:SRPBCC family protein n=1 Tax=Streptomyces sp. ISL-12 TaxID=2819177 RepID=UPI001BE5DD0C|nr:SRPBCC family protein [Streptomyces sp. ISL-12]MBT2414685.1 SRPBCC family protein [Streptomyces sp. ISL-12]